MKVRRARPILLFLLLLALPLLLSACGSPPDEAKSDGEPPRRVAVLFSSYAEMWKSAGGEIAVTVGEAVERGFAAVGTPLADAGAGKSINTELLLSYAPDLVILSADIPAQMEAKEVLDTAGIPTLALHVETFDDYLFAFRQMTDITKNADAYQAKAELLRTEIETLLAGTSAEGSEILFVRAGTTASSVKPKRTDEHFAAAMLREFGCVNISDEGLFSSGLNMESVIARDPDYVFFSVMGDEEGVRRNVEEMLKEPAWQALSAVQSGRVFILPKELFHFKPCERWAEAYRYLAELLTEEDGR